MSTRTGIHPQVVINAASMAANITSTPTILQSLTGCSYAFSWTGTAPVGTLSIQVSNDYAIGQTGQVSNAGTWTTLVLNVGGTPSTTVAVSGTPGTAFIDVDSTMAYAIRSIYTATIGTGSLTATFVGKVA
jgi:hypothetical protein